MTRQESFEWIASGMVPQIPAMRLVDAAIAAANGVMSGGVSDQDFPQWIALILDIIDEMAPGFEEGGR